MSEVTSRPKEAPALAERIGNWFAACRRTLREIRAQSELAHKLEGVDEHLLRDVGLTRTGGRIERVSDATDRYR